PHLAGLPALRLAEDGPSGLDPFPRSPAPIGALELGGEPGANAEDLARSEGDLGLMVRYVTPVRPDRVASVKWRRERRFDEHRAGCEHRQQQLDVPPGPAGSKCVD